VLAISMETTGYGGAGNCVLLGGTVGCGTAFGLSPPQQKGGSWTETVLYSFQGDKDGHVPHDDLVFDKQGNIYGATTPRLAILHHKNSNRGFVHDVPPQSNRTQNSLESCPPPERGHNNGGLFVAQKLGRNALDLIAP